MNIMTYQDLVRLHKDKIRLKFLVVIDNNTLRKSYAVYTNLHCDYGLVGEMLNHYHGNKKSKFRERCNFYKKTTGRRWKLVGTDNDTNYTRLVYSLV